MSIEVKIPEVGESITEAQIGKWLKNEGDAVEKDEAVVELETDKVSVEAPAPATGVIGKILKREGEMANVGDVIAIIEEGGAAPASKEKKEKSADGKGKKAPAADERNGKASAKSTEKKSTPAPATKAEAPADESAEARIMPAAQRVLDERQVNASDVEGTGPGGRVLKEDALRHLEKRDQDRAVEPKPFAVAQEAPTDGDRDEETIPMTPMRRRIAERLVQVQQTSALLTTFNEVDMSAVMELRKTYRDSFEKRYDVRLGFMSFFVKASVEALKSLPQVNASIDGQNIVFHNYYDIGIAVSTERGLVVPILRNAERLSFAEVETRIGDFAKRAREKKLSLEELEGGTFSITNGGVFGSLLSTPIVNPPQSAILGLHAIQERPVAVNGQVVIRPMMYIALTYDHRLVDGREAVTFLKRIKEIIEDPSRMLLEV